MIIEIKITKQTQDSTIVLENSNGDTFTIKSDEAIDFFNSCSAKF